MIPGQINQAHILDAIHNVNERGVPKRRHAREWALMHQGRQYPVKLLISWAYESIDGQEWSPKKFISTEARQYLEYLGFTIINLN